MAASPLRAGEPVGRWLAVEGDETSLIEIYREGETLSARLLAVHDAQGRALDRRCTRCPGEAREVSVIGLRFLWDLRWQGDRWGGGRVMDLREGVTQGTRARAELRVDGDRLELFGWLGLRALGETRVWTREPAPPTASASP